MKIDFRAKAFSEPVEGNITVADGFYRLSHHGFMSDTIEIIRGFYLERFILLGY